MVGGGTRGRYHARFPRAELTVRTAPPTSFVQVRAEASALARLGAPLIVTQVSQVGMGFTDTVMAGRLGAIDLAAVALGSSLFVPVYLACVGVLLALSPTTAQWLGAGAQERIGPLFRQGLWLALGLAVLATPAVVATGAAMAPLGVDPALRPVTEDYLRAIAWGMPGLCLYLAARYVAEGVGQTRPIMYIQLGALVLNAFGNWVLMFGNLGAPALGAAGAGWSSAIVLWLDAALLCACLAWQRRFRYLGLWRRLEAPDRKVLGHLLRHGVPISLTIVLEVGLFSAVALLMGRLGAVATAAHQIALNYAALMFMLPLGLSMAVTIRVGQLAGANQSRALRRAGMVGIAMGAGVMAVSAAVMLLAPGAIVALYTDDDAVAAAALQLLAVAAMFQLSDGVQVTAMGALRGLKDTSWPLAVNLLSYWGIGLSLAWYWGLEAGLGAVGMWYGLVCGLSSAALLLTLRFVWRSAPHRGPRFSRR